MSCSAYEAAAARYEGWYGTPRGQRVDRAERDLLDWLLAPLGPIDGLLDVGCGTATPRAGCGADAGASSGSIVARHGPRAARPAPRNPVVIGDVARLPFQARSGDAALFVTVLEFVDDPRRFVCEAAEVARRGIVVVAPKGWCAGGLSRRLRPQSRSPLRSRAHD